MNLPKVVSYFFRREKVVSVLSIGKVVGGKVGAAELATAPNLRKCQTYPDMIISSSTPYSFMCWSPQPSLILLGIYFFRKPVRFGV